MGTTDKTMKPKVNLLIAAVILFAIGFMATPLIALLHVQQDAAQVILGINWISGGLGCVVLDTIRRELQEVTKP
jgi:hypothetical protein